MLVPTSRDYAPCRSHPDTKRRDASARLQIEQKTSSAIKIGGQVVVDYIGNSRFQLIKRPDESGQVRYIPANTNWEVLWQMYAMDSPVRSWQLSTNVDGSWYASLLFDWNIGHPKINKQISTASRDTGPGERHSSLPSPTYTSANCIHSIFHTSRHTE